MQDIKDLTQCQLKTILTQEGFPKFSSTQIFGWIYKKRIEDFSLMTDISRNLRNYLKSNFCLSGLKLKSKRVSSDKTIKFLFALKDNSFVETALIPEGKRNTLCLSTQVGCKYKCNFCTSGLNGFMRNLSTSEIINQFLQVQNYISPKKITNVVFMGVGEPLDNFDNLIKAIKIFMDSKGLYLGKRKICISTSGLIPQIRKLTQLGLGVRLSVSLHSADNRVRSCIMPVNKKYPLPDLMKALREFVKKEKFSITFEYILIKNLNSKKEDAVKLANLLKHMDCKVNFILYNPSPHFKWQPPTSHDLEEFNSILKKKGIFFTLRKARGQDIEAGCGQLRAQFKRGVVLA